MADARALPVDPPAGRADAWYNDLHVYDPAAAAWAVLEPRGGGPVPEPRSCAGFAVSGDTLYIFGGYGTSGLWPRRASMHGRAEPDSSVAIGRRIDDADVTHNEATDELCIER